MAVPVSAPHLPIAIWSAGAHPPLRQIHGGWQAPLWPALLLALAGVAIAAAIIYAIWRRDE